MLGFRACRAQVTALATPTHVKMCTQEGKRRVGPRGVRTNLNMRLPLVALLVEKSPVAVNKNIPG